LKHPDFRIASGFEWTPKREEAALKFAEGLSAVEIAKEIGVTDRTLRYWMAETEFSAEVDRLSVMTGIASQNERLRIANRVIREKVRGEIVDTDKDILDWIKFAQSETDGINLNLDAAFLEATAPVADSGQEGVDSESKAGSEAA